VLLWTAAYLLAIVLHEVAHLVAARLAGIRVERFFIGLDAGDFALLRYRRDATTWGIGWLPLGGYVKLVGLPGPSIAFPPSYDYRSKSNGLKAMVIGIAPALNVVAGLLLMNADESLWYQPFAVMQLWLGVWNLIPRPGTDGHHLMSLLRAVLFSPRTSRPTSQP
jgi:membrane-associated protease RseP (regulator of RpoE activity)